MTPQQESAQEKWERSNRLSLILRKSRVLKSIRGSIPECDKAKDYLKAIEEQFVIFDKALANTLMKRLSGIKYNRAKGVREHIMEMRNIAAQLKALNVEISDTFFVTHRDPAEARPAHTRPAICLQHIRRLQQSDK
uniref:Retrovirus-related Pol polyprotein from transposon TNT 1-94 n=1 Tax=Ananas comosus var. bracteatus TaxID=296719 RepID=A0A6V7PFZ0_ANACO|nr:unnamed protein product [Ananas comosus var. bracteatus]